MWIHVLSDRLILECRKIVVNFCYVPRLLIFIYILGKNWITSMKWVTMCESLTRIKAESFWKLISEYMSLIWTNNYIPSLQIYAHFLCCTDTKNGQVPVSDTGTDKTQLQKHPMNTREERKNDSWYIPDTYNYI